MVINYGHGQAQEGGRLGQRDSAAAFKTHCLELADRVRETGAEFIVTKHGRPGAKLVPYREPAKRKLFGLLKGTVLHYDRPLDPIDGHYDINRN